MNEKYKNLKRAEKGAMLSIITYIILSFGKLIVGYFSNSKALFSDGLNNLTDIVSSLAVFIGVKISRKPADDNHPYGHFRAETIASLIASLIMIYVGVTVLYDAAYSVVSYQAQAPNLIAALVALLSAVFLYFVYRKNKKLALKVNSAGLMAAAKDNLSDAWVSIGAAIGIIASQFGFPWIDPLAAVVVGFLIIKTGWDIFRDATHNLTDGFNKEKLVHMTESILDIDGVKDVRNIKARQHGNNILVDVTIIVNANLNVVEGHNITEDIEQKLTQEYNISEVVVHVEPDL